MSDGSRHSFAFIAEVTYGTTPATPVMQNLRATGINIGMSKTSQESGEIRSDRQITSFKHGTRKVGGGFNFELSYGSFDVLLQAVLGGTWAADVLKAGTLKRSFSIERYYGDILAADGAWHRFTGCMFDTLELSVPTEGKVTGSFGLIGKDMTIGTALITGATYTAVSTTDVMDSFTGTIQEGGSSIAIITEIKLSLKNGVAPKMAIGSQTTTEPSWGRSNVSGSITAYFENAALLNKFINETESSLSFVVNDAAGNNYTFLIPRIKYTGGTDINVSGEGPITLSLPFQAMRDTGQASNIVITRDPA
jgi:hypothetical protein